MSNKFDSFISEMMGSEGSSETEVIRSIRQDLTKCSSNLDNLADRYQRTSSEALAIRRAMMKVDEARKILFDLQD
jgi:hypothetical protein